MGVHCGVVVLLSLMFYSRHLFPMESLKTKTWPWGPFLFSLSLLLEKYTEEKTILTVEERKQHRKIVESQQTKRQKQLVKIELMLNSSGAENIV